MDAGSIHGRIRHAVWGDQQAPGAEVDNAKQSKATQQTLAKLIPRDTACYNPQNSQSFAP